MHEKDWLGPLPSEERLDLGQKVIEVEVLSERERFWEVKRLERSREMRFESRRPFI